MKNIDCVRSVVESSLQSGGFHLDTGKDVSSAGKSMRRIQYRRNVGDQTCTIIVAISMLGQWVVVTASVVSDNQNYCTSLSGEDFATGTLSREAGIALSNDILRPLAITSARMLNLDGPANLDTIPLDLVERIALLLEVQSVLSLAQTCKSLQYVSDLERVWQELCKKKKLGRSGDGMTWKVCYVTGLKMLEYFENFGRAQRGNCGSTALARRQAEEARARRMMDAQPFIRRRRRGSVIFGDEDRLPNFGAGLPPLHFGARNPLSLSSRLGRRARDLALQ